MKKPRVWITRRIPQRGLDLISPYAEIDLWEDELPPSYDVILEKVRGIEGLLCLLTDRIDDRVLDAAGSSLRVISQFAVGYDNIDISAATARKIPVGNTPGVLTDATADFTWALLMAAARRVIEGDRFVRSGGWKTWGPTFLLGADIARSTLGIIGFGRIGQAVARRARGFEMRVLYFDPQRHLALEQELGASYAPLEDVLQEADFISIHTPLTPETYHLISDAQFALMKSGAILINTARGSIVDPQALYRALSTHRIAAAALDVTEPEPIPPDSPLLSLENLLITPHIASASFHSRTRMAEMAAENLLAGLRGEQLPNCVNPEVYQRTQE
ncbi:lactate dehydrogenase [Anaerolinea thermolimosa]|uniref:2-hydroxyacid dehydrogenase n=1 Tax=Anaerolinea thermolimosa TaxID=229919 RepID=UPI00078593A6|nr:D-glycerate dehydrogenase [Anaerolinea thermolimosa]GAP06632.1 lactate dehydrogenase [Anaerolinea thermolimosa]